MTTRIAAALLRRPRAMGSRQFKIYLDLVDHLYSDVGSVAGGVVGFLVLAWVSHYFDPQPEFIVVMALVAVVGLGRLASILRYRSLHHGRPRSFRTARRWEISYALGAVSFAFIVGVFGLLVAADTKTMSIEVLVTASVVGYAGGIAGRNAVRPIVAMSQVVAAFVPLAAFCLYEGGGVRYGIAAMLAIYAVTLAKIVFSLERITNKAFEMQRDVGEVNSKLDTAITHMKSGLCMTDADGNIDILNQRARELLRLPEKSEYHKIHEVLLGALGAGTLSHADVAAIQAGIAERQEIIVRTGGVQSTVLTLRAALTPDGGTVLTLDDITELTKAAADIERMAKFDSLTGLANRATAMAALAQAVVEAGSEGSGSAKAALLLIDLDKFKDVNDTLGHDVGDQLLIKAADRLGRTVPANATVGRLGGDEFIVVAPGLDVARAEQLAGQINAILGKPMRLSGQLCSTTASIGIAIAGEHGTDPSELVKAADIALYARKGAGRNGHDVFDSVMALGLARRRRLEQDLAATLGGAGLSLAFQPIVTSGPDNRLVAFETLARWTHPEFGVVTPDEFIPIAESTGLISELGRHILTGACREAMRWPDDIKVSVNVSAVQLRNREGLFDDIWAALTASGLPAKRLDLEMTESVLIDDAEGVQTLIEALRKMDISISLDDFGTGYSSLAYVQNYRFDRIKLDKAFARTIEHDATTRATIAALANIAAATGSRLLLEGVETAEQARIAHANGVHELQGFYFSKPKPGTQILEEFRGARGQIRAA